MSISIAEMLISARKIIPGQLSYFYDEAKLVMSEASDSDKVMLVAFQAHVIAKQLNDFMEMNKVVKMLQAKGVI